MEVLGFQVLFFVVILVSGLFGRKARNFVVIASLIFTVIMVFMTWLIILQFVTIIVAYFITENYVESSKKKLDDIDKSYGSGCLSLIVGGGILLIILKLCSDNYKSNSTTISDENTSAKTKSIAVEPEYASEITSYQNQNFTENSASEFNNTYEFEQNEFDENRTSSNSLLSNEEVINNFISAENSRDFGTMSLYLSEYQKRFWNIKFPQSQQISNSYYQTWSKYDYTHTEILGMREINPYHYIVKVRFEYDGKSKINIINFEFDYANNITAIY